MSSSQLFIPTKIKVGYQERSDTYSKRLAYIIYYDNKNILRKETSWNSWRDDKIEPSDFKNIPTSGFVLNKKAGGNSNYSWNQRQTYCRVYDPRGFEFEITIPNLLFILQECDCSKGKGLEGDFVYGWDGKDLVLLPAAAEEYKQSVEYTLLQDEKVKAKDLIEGCVYLNNRMEQYIYLGKYNYNNRGWSSDYETPLSEKKEYIFVPTKPKEKSRYYSSSYHNLSSMVSIKKLVSDIPVDNFSTLLQEFLDSPYSSEFSHYDYLPLSEETLEYHPSYDGDYFDVYKTNGDSKMVRLYFKNENEGWFEIPEKSNYSHYRKYWDNFDSINQKSITIDEIITNYFEKCAIYKNNSKKII